MRTNVALALGANDHRTTDGAFKSAHVQPIYRLPNPAYHVVLVYDFLHVARSNVWLRSIRFSRFAGFCAS